MTEYKPADQGELSEPSDEQDKTITLSLGGALELPAGRIVQDRYRVIEEVGRGGMGVVYRVEQILLGREMALKTLDGQDVKDATWRRFQQEARATGMLDHPNLITVHDSGIIDDKHPYFVMDFVQGTTLAKLVEEKGPLSVEEALPIFIQVCFGLAYAHDLGIVHRDLKPSNIMLVQPPGGGALTVKIVDFGIAKLHLAEGTESQSLTKTGEIFGSPLYMSPEQCLGVAVDHRSDIYALGCVIFETLTGLPPFLGSTSLSTMMKHQSEKPPTLKEATLGKEFPPEIESLVARLLEKEPDKRYQSLNALARDLSLLQQGISAESLKQIGASDSEKISNKRFSNSEMAIACLSTAAVFATASWMINDLFDSAEGSRTIDKEVAKQVQDFKTHYEPGSRYPEVSETVQSSKRTLKNGKKIRRIYFVKPAGNFNLAGDDLNTFKAAGIYDIPFEKSIHLRLKDLESMENPNYFLQFQEEDITELTSSGRFGVTDTTMKGIGHLRLLNNLKVGANDVSDDSIQYINQLPLLHTLYIGFTGITEEGACRLKRLKDFTNFGVAGLKSVSRLLSILKSSSKIQKLGVEKCNLTKEDLKTIASMKTIMQLNIDENKVVDDESLKLLVPLQNLETLLMKHTRVTAASLETYKSFPKLKEVVLGLDQWAEPGIIRFQKTYPKIKLTVQETEHDMMMREQKKKQP
ncbi:MAG: protein kinase [Candidatus Melainabacteria bacterium]|nr:protein kinase [Candidatus Melainabacteria bacterium]